MVVLSLKYDMSRFAENDSIHHLVTLRLEADNLVPCSGVLLANASPFLEVCKDNVQIDVLIFTNFDATV